VFIAEKILLKEGNGHLPNLANWRGFYQ